jgi:TusA-related sulfurtransferase
MTLEAIKKGSPHDLIVLVDTDTSRENVMRAAQSQGYTVQEVAPEGEGYRIHIVKG